MNKRDKTQARSLAIQTGSPLFKSPLHVGRPNVGDVGAFLGRVEEMLNRRWFTNDGPLVREFEQAISDLTGVRHCVAMCNATIALEHAARALEMTGEVIVPAFTFVATAHCLQWQEITPVFCDIDPETHNIDPSVVERLITPRTTGIIGVHVWGRPCDTEGIERVAAKHKLKVIYDAAHALGCSHKGKMVGHNGSCEVFSFHATKFVNSFEGGAVVTNSDELADKLRFMRNFGFSGTDGVAYLGSNGKMTEVCAAMGLSSLESIDRLIEVNRRNWGFYRQHFCGLPGINLIDIDSMERSNYQYVVAEVDASVCPLSRDEIVSVLHAENVLVRKYFWPGVHKMEPYRSLQPNAGLLLPQTEKIASRVLLFPNGELIGEDEIYSIAGVMASAMANAPEVRKYLKGTPGGIRA